MFLIFLNLIEIALAAPKSDGSASVFDLKWGAVNFLLLAGFLIWKLKKPLAASFANYSEEVKSLYNHAQEKYKEADLKLKMYEEKLSNVEGQSQKILSESNELLQKIENDIKNETANELKKLEVETKDKIESEKTQLITGVNNELLESVLTNVKTKLNSDTSLSQKINHKMISSLNLRK